MTLSSIFTRQSFTVAAVILAVASLTGMSEARSRTGSCGNDKAVGAIAGAVLGGVVGGQFGGGSDDRALAAIAGALIGGTAGASIASENCDAKPHYGAYDSRNNAYDSYAGDNAYSSPAYEYGPRYAAQPEPYYDVYYDQGRSFSRGAYYDAFEHGESYQRAQWHDERGYAGYVTPSDYYRDERGRTCRTYQQEIYVDGQWVMAEGTACRSRNGAWKIID